MIFFAVAKRQLLRSADHRGDPGVLEQTAEQHELGIEVLRQRRFFEDESLLIERDADARFVDREGEHGLGLA